MAMPKAEVTRWLPHAPSAAVEARGFCVPHAGCGAGRFRSWPRQRSSVEFFPVELPGRETRLGDRVIESYADIIAAMVPALSPYLDVPFAFFGHCWSGLVDYEATIHLQRAAMPMPMRLFVSSQAPPPESPAGRMLGMDDTEIAEELTKTIRALGDQPHPELMDLYTDVLRADVEASRRYRRPTPVRLGCPITAIGWADDDEVPPEQMAGWSKCGDTIFKVFPGGHHRFIDGPDELLSTLCSGLEAW